MMDAITHEIPGHFGAAAVLKGNPAVYEKLWNLFQADKESEFGSEIARRYEADRAAVEAKYGPEAGEERVFNEWLAERVRQRVQKNLSVEDKGVLAKIVDALKEFFADLLHLKINNMRVVDAVNRLIKQMKTAGAAISEETGSPAAAMRTGTAEAAQKEIVAKIDDLVKALKTRETE
jgi:hypothetical protein